MKHFTKLIFFIMLIATFTCCKKNQPTQNEINIATPLEIKKNHTWYYFTPDGYKQIEKIANVPFVSLKPWTEATRLSSANITNNSNAFAVVNRLGMLSFEDENISLATDINLFSDRTAGNLIFVNDSPVFSVYKSSFFNDTVTNQHYKNDQGSHLFLVQFDNTAKISYPLINCNNLTDEPNTEITDFYCDGQNWICSVKTISDVKNSFSYVKFNSSVPLLTLSPSSANNFLEVTQSSVEEYRKIKQYIDYKNAPQRIKSLLGGFDNSLPFIIEVKSAGGSSPRVYENVISLSKEKDLQAKAIIAQSWSAALFEDGTMFIEGALQGKHILRGGKAVAIKLPKLPSDYVYSDFVISGTTLYAAWEESAFYKTGKSGFLQVNLEKTLYSKVK